MRKIIFWVLPITFLVSVVILVIFPQQVEIMNYKDGVYFLKSDSSRNIMIKVHGQQPDKPRINYYTFPNDSLDVFLNENGIEKYQPMNDMIRDTFMNINKIFAIGDVHGEYEGLKKLLINNGIIDTNLNWIFEDNHLVFCGDVFDRGNQVTECLWLIYNLEQQARVAGGCVHYILGNHEVMILNGDTRYVHEKYKTIQQETNIPYPFLFNKTTILGSWLRKKNAVVKINDMLFLHGGIHPKLIQKKMSISHINNSIRAFLVDETMNVRTSFLLGMEGVLWYRGYISDENLKLSDVQHILDYYSVKNIVFAHTTVDAISSFFSDRLIAVDVPMSKDNATGLFISKGKLQPVNILGKPIDILKK